MIIGIDPGCTGALVMMNAGGEIVDALMMPTVKQGKSSRVNGAAIAAWITQHQTDRLVSHCYIEQVASMPGQGVASMFSFGHAAGVVEGVISGLNIPITKVTPQAWKKTAGLIGKDKDAARSRAIQLYPNLRILDTKDRGQAVADAILIALHGQR